MKIGKLLLGMLMLTASGVQAQSSGLIFDGTDDCVSIGAPLSQNSSYTKEAWVYVTKNTMLPTNIISSKQAPFWIDGGYMKAGNNGPMYELQDPGLFPANTWVHVAVTYDASNYEMKLYRDGVMVQSIISEFSYTGENNYIGAWFNGTGTESTMGGKMDEVRIWNVARTATEIAANMYHSAADIAHADGLVAVYGMNEGSGTTAANNSTGTSAAPNTNGMLLYGTAWGDAALVNNALDFDGINDRVTIPASTAFDISTGTIECWVKPDGLSGNACILGSRNVSQARYSFHMSANTIGLWNGNSFGTVSFTHTPGQWYHLAFVCTPSATSVYVNGSLIGNTSNVIGSATNLTFNIGIADAANFEAFKGAIDEVRIWNTARTQQMIQDNMHTRFGNTTSNLIALFDFNQGTAGGNNAGLTTAVDRRNSRNGTLYNFALNGNTSNWVGKVIATPAVASVPVINSFNPASGTAGTLVTIHGGGFNTTAANNIVYFGGAKASVLSADENTLTVQAPGGATYQPITVTNKESGLTGYASGGFITTFAGGSVSFSPKTDYSSHADNRGVAFADMDGDGLSDLILTNSMENSVSVFMNSGNPGAEFTNRQDYHVGSDPRTIAIADMNGDGKLDIITGNYAAASFAVLLNNSTLHSISFEPPVFEYQEMYSLRNIAVGDIDGDGKPDVAVTHSSNSILVFRNTGSNGSVSFDLAGEYYTEDTYVTGIVISDLNGDAKPELAVLNYNNRTVAVFPNASNPGTISFEPNTEFPIGFYSWSLYAADVDGDGRNDLLTTGNKAVSILQNTGGNGMLHFNDVTDFSLGSMTPWAIAIGDVTGDGRADVIAVNGDEDGQYPGLVSVFANTGMPGTLALATRVDLATAAGPMGIAIGDVNGDAKPDIAVGHLSNPVSLFYNTTGVIAVQPPLVHSFSPGSGAVGTTVEITGEGFSETPENNIVYFGATRAAVTASTANSLTVNVPAGATYQFISVTNKEKGLIGYSAKPFNLTFTPGAAAFATRKDLAGVAGPHMVAFGDLDGDGKMDMAVANAVQPVISFFRNTGNSNNVPTYEETSIYMDQFVNSITIGDIDGDGRPDLAASIADNNSPHITVLRNSGFTGSINFDPAINYATDTDPGHIAIGDLNSDGKPELIVTNQSHFSVSVLVNKTANGTLDFDYYTRFDVNGTPSKVVIADLNGDNKPDLAMNNTDADHFILLLNTGDNGSLSFDLQGYSTNSIRVGNLVSGDLNGDGKMDIATLNDGGSISVFQNMSDANYPLNLSHNGNLLTSAFASDLAIGDVDGDGRPDLVTVDYNDVKASFYKNNSNSGLAGFESRIEFPTGIGFQKTALADMNGDGKMDITLFDASQTGISMLQNNTSITPLPVTLLTFSAAKKADKVALSWSTASESNSSRFEVERSTDGRSYGRVATVSAAGESTQKLDYSAEDKMPATGMNHYRLKLVDKDGSFKYSPVASISWTNEATATLTLAPQPMLDVMNITIAGVKEKGNFIIYDMTGKKVTSFAISGNTGLQVNKGQLVSGIYVYKLVSLNGAVLATGKIIVQ